MKLKFFAKRDLLVTTPEQAILRGNVDTGAQGSPVRYVGREHVPAVTERVNGQTVVRQGASNPATAEPFECEADSDMGRRLVKIVRRDQCLWPADKETAEACSLPFVELKFVDGEHVEADPKPVLDRNGCVKLCSPVGTPGEKWAGAKPSSNTPLNPGNPTTENIGQTTEQTEGTPATEGAPGLAVAVPDGSRKPRK